MRTNPPVITIFIGLSLNPSGLHSGENGFALGQGQSDGLRSNRTCRGRWPVASSRVSTCPFAPVSSSKTRHFIPFPRSITTGNL